TTRKHRENIYRTATKIGRAWIYLGPERGRLGRRVQLFQNLQGPCRSLPRCTTPQGKWISSWSMGDRTTRKHRENIYRTTTKIGRAWIYLGPDRGGLGRTVQLSQNL